MLKNKEIILKSRNIMLMLQRMMNRYREDVKKKKNQRKDTL